VVRRPVCEELFGLGAEVRPGVVFLGRELVFLVELAVFDLVLGGVFDVGQRAVAFGEETVVALLELTRLAEAAGSTLSGHVLSPTSMERGAGIYCAAAGTPVREIRSLRA